MTDDEKNDYETRKQLINRLWQEKRLRDVKSFAAPLSNISATDRRPFVKQVHFNERLIIPTIFNDFRHGEIEIVPLVDVKQDASYTGTPLPFEACIEKVTQTFDWGRNNYIVTYGTIQTNFVVHQRK